MAQNYHLPADIIEQLAIVLPLELMAVQQHFIHVLILKEWNADELSQGIVEVDEVDLPNAMRIVDLLVALGKTPVIGLDPQSQSDQMPAAGNTYEGIFSAERSIEKKLVQALNTAKATLQPDAESTASRLITTPLLARTKFERWMRLQEQVGLPENVPLSILSEASLSSINQYFAHLVVAINQQMIHAFVHWHNGEKQLADTAWAASGGAMMQATAITNLLARRRLSPSPEVSGCTGGLLPQQIGATVEQALRFDQELTLGCSFAAEQAKRALNATEFESVCQNGMTYFGHMSKWQPGVALPKIVNPCLNFERVLRQYVWDNEDTSRAMA